MLCSAPIEAKMHAYLPKHLPKCSLGAKMYYKVSPLRSQYTCFHANTHAKMSSWEAKHVI